MNIYTCTTFKGHWPVGTAAVVIASDEAQGAALLAQELVRVGLPQVVSESALKRLCGAANGTRAGVLVLNDGEYE